MYAGVPSTKPAISETRTTVSFALCPSLGSIPLAVRQRDRFRHAEVGDDGVAAVDQDVGRLHVAVHHAVRVRVRQRVGHLADDRDDVGERQPSLALEPLLQRLALDVAAW